MFEKIKLILFLLSISLSAQNMRFVYDYRSIPDTLRKNHIIDETMILEVDPQNKRSIFYSFIKMRSDSIMKANESKNVMLFPDSRIHTRYVVEKNNETKEMFFYTRNYSIVPVSRVKDDRQLKWNIMNERKEILSYPVQKATVDFGGRKWTAWFTTKIPFSDGPYKFSGLPGLIIELSDATKSHHYELVGIKKIDPPFYQLLTDSSYYRLRDISLQDYKKELLAERKDPMRNIRQNVFQGRVYFKSEERKAEYLKEHEVRLKREMRENNNPIELDEIDIDDN